MFFYREAVQLLASEEYGLRCLLQVAWKAPGPEGPPLSTQCVAEAEGLSAEYAAKLLRTLRLGGLVTSARGAGGGYRLARPARDISVWDALSVLGGPLYSEGFCRGFAGPGAPGGGAARPDAACRGGACVHDGDCALRAVWRAVEGALRGVLERVSLDDLRRSELASTEWLAVVTATGGEEACRS
ncbi:MAG: RrF2 family transcriptional regulator [Myxococcota bacterium]